MTAAIDINGKKLLPIKEVILQVDYSRDYITRLAREKKIVATQIGRHWYIDLDSLKNYQLVVQAEQEIKKRQLSNERKHELAIKERKEAKRTQMRQRIRRKTPAIAMMVFIVSLGVGVGTFLESQSRSNFVNLNQLANIKTFALQTPKETELNVADFVSGSENMVSPDFAPTVMHRDLSSDEGLLLLPRNASGTVRTNQYFSDPVTVFEDETGQRSVRRVDTDGTAVGEEIPFVIVPVNTNSP